MPERKRTDPRIETQVLLRSARRCCLCFHLEQDFSEKRGQIAHLDQDPSNGSEDNLAFLCLDHHSLYDSRTSQYKNFTITEAKSARARLYEEVERRNPRGRFVVTPPQPYFAHPYPLQENFTGRLSERRMLTEWLTSGHNVLSITAIGGMGKSALTWVWLQKDVIPAVQLDGVLWWSFYEREASFPAFVREALQYASGGQTADSLFDQIKLLTTLLMRKRLLLVLDGFERELRAYAGLNAAYQGDDVQPDGDARSCIEPRAGGFLRWIAAAPMAARALLTSRLHPRELDGLVGCEHRI